MFGAECSLPVVHLWERAGERERERKKIGWKSICSACKWCLSKHQSHCVPSTKKKTITFHWHNILDFCSLLCKTRPKFPACENFKCECPLATTGFKMAVSVVLRVRHHRGARHKTYFTKLDTISSLFTHLGQKIALKIQRKKSADIVVATGSWKEKKMQI